MDKEILRFMSVITYEDDPKAQKESKTFKSKIKKWFKSFKLKFKNFLNRNIKKHKH